MELKTDLSHGDVARAVASAFPNRTFTIIDPIEDNSGFSVVFDGPSVTGAQLNAAIAAYSSASAVLDRSRAVLFGQVDSALASKLAAWTYQGHACPITDSLKIGAREAVTVVGSAPISWNFGNGVVMQMAAADLATFIMTREAYEQACRTFAAGLIAEITAASSAKSLAALDLTSGWPTPQG